MVGEALTMTRPGIIYATVTSPATDAGDARVITSAPQDVTLELVQLGVYATGNTATSSPVYWLLPSETEAADGTIDISVPGTGFSIGLAPAAATTSIAPITAPITVFPINTKGHAGPRVIIPPGMLLAFSPDANTNGDITHTCITREVTRSGA